MSTGTQSNIFVRLDDLVSAAHPCRHFDGLPDCAELSGPLTHLYSHKGRKEPGAERALRMLVLQFMEMFSRVREGLKHVCPGQGAVYADKGYCTRSAQDILKKKGCYDASLK